MVDFFKSSSKKTKLSASRLEVEREPLGVGFFVIHLCIICNFLFIMVIEGEGMDCSRTTHTTT